MKAVICEKYGPPGVLKLREIEKPAPKNNEILVKIIATTVTAGDVRMRSFNVPRGQRLPARLYLGLRRPKRGLGMELSGIVESVGPAVTLFKPADEIMASTFEANFGGYAEYKCFSEKKLLVKKPVNASFSEAAAIPVGGLTALRFLKKAGVEEGHKVIIYGASGSVGTYAVQLAKILGAHVTGVCSARNLEMVKEFGADEVFDYTGNNFKPLAKSYDVVMDAVGKGEKKLLKSLVKKGGQYLNVLVTHASGSTTADLEYLSRLVEDGSLKPYIDKVFTLDEIQIAHAYVEQGHKRGNVAIQVVG